MLKAIVLVVLLMLSGCFGTFTTKNEARISESLLQPCETLNSVDGKSGKHLTETTVSNAAVFHRCADGKLMLIEAVRSQQGKPK